MRDNAPALSLILLLFLLTAAATAEDPTLTAGWAMTHDLPEGMVSSDTTRTVAGDFTGDLRPDVCMLAGGVAYLAFAPNCYPSIEPIPTSVISSPVKDLAFLPRGGGPGALLFLTGNGVEVVSFSSGGFVHEETIAASGWASARALRVLDYGGTGDPDLVGVSGNGLGLLRIRDLDGTRVFENDSPGRSTIFEIEPLDWTGNGMDEVAVRFGNHIEIHDANGSIATRQTPEAPVLMQSVEFPAQADRLVVVAWTDAGAAQALHLYGADGSASETFLGPVDITASDSGDTDLDGDGDLLLANRTDYLMPYLLNRHEFDPGQPFSVVPGSAFLYTASGLPATDNRTEPVLLDLDNEGDLDMTVVIGDDRTLLVQRNNLVEEHKSWVMISDRPEDAWLISHRATPDELSLLVYEPEVDPIGFNGIEIRVWRQDDIASPAVLYSERLLPVSAGFGWRRQDFAIDEPEPPFDAIYTFEFRTVVTAGIDVTNAGPTSFFFYTTQADVFDDLRDEGVGMPNYHGLWSGPENVEDQAWSGGTGPTPTGPDGSGDNGGTGGG